MFDTAKTFYALDMLPYEKTVKVTRLSTHNFDHDYRCYLNFVNHNDFHEIDPDEFPRITDGKISPAVLTISIDSKAPEDYRVPQHLWPVMRDLLSGIIRKQEKSGIQFFPLKVTFDRQDKWAHTLLDLVGRDILAKLKPITMGPKKSLIDFSGLNLKGLAELKGIKFMKNVNPPPVKAVASDEDESDKDEDEDDDDEEEEEKPAPYMKDFIMDLETARNIGKEIRPEFKLYNPQDKKPFNPLENKLTKKIPEKKLETKPAKKPEPKPVKKLAEKPEPKPVKKLAEKPEKKPVKVEKIEKKVAKKADKKSTQSAKN